MTTAIILIGAFLVLALGYYSTISWRCPRCGCKMQQLGTLKRMICTNPECKLQIS